MIIERMFPSGGYCITDIVNGYFVTRRYFGYTKREAVRRFKAFIKVEFKKGKPS